VSRDTPRRARVHPETGLEVPVFFLTTQFLYGFAGTAQPFVWPHVKALQAGAKYLAL
jgi:hypothetical protein